jgi:hypothetical protein
MEEIIMANYFDNIKNAPEHVVAESSRLTATGAGHIYDLEMIEDTDNGTIVAVGAHVEGQLFKAKEYAAGDKPYLVLTPPLAYNGKRGWSDEKYFYNAKGEIARAYELHVGDIYTLSAKAFDGEPAVGKYVDATHTVAESAGANYAGLITEEVHYTNSVSYRVRVVKI